MKVTRKLQQWVTVMPKDSSKAFGALLPDRYRHSSDHIDVPAQAFLLQTNVEAVSES